MISSQLCASSAESSGSSDLLREAIANLKCPTLPIKVFERNDESIKRDQTAWYSCKRIKNAFGYNKNGGQGYQSVLVKSLFEENVRSRDALVKILLAAKEELTLDSFVKNVDCMIAFNSNYNETSKAFFNECILQTTYCMEVSRATMKKRSHGFYDGS